MSHLLGLDLGLAILLAVFKLGESGVRFFAFWEQEGQKHQALHISPKLKPITRRIKERKRKGKCQLQNLLW